MGKNKGEQWFGCEMDGVVFASLTSLSARDWNDYEFQHKTKSTYTSTFMHSEKGQITIENKYHGHGGHHHYQIKKKKKLE